MNWGDVWKPTWQPKSIITLKSELRLREVFSSNRLHRLQISLLFKTHCTRHEANHRLQLHSLSRSSYLRHCVALTSSSGSGGGGFLQRFFSSLQKKSLGANYSHKWSPAVEYKAWNVDFQLSFHLKLRKSACSINSLDPPPLKSYFPDFFFFTSQHAHLCRSSAAMSLQRYLPPKIHQDSLFTSSLISEKKEELLQSRAWFVMFIACQPAWVALNDATLHLRWFCIEHCVNWMNFKIQLLLFLPLCLVSLLHSSSLFDFALITSCREITSNLLELLNFGFFFQDKRKLNIFKILLEFKTSKFSNFHNLFLKYDSYWAFGHDVTHEDTFRSIYFVVNSLTQRIMSEYAYRVWANSR